MGAARAQAVSTTAHDAWKTRHPFESQADADCLDCGGTGEVPDGQEQHRPYLVTLVCATCDGTGEAPEAEDPNAE